VAISIVPTEIASADFVSLAMTGGCHPEPPRKMQTVKMKMQNDRATVKNFAF
jgi:hypothetical protein